MYNTYKNTRFSLIFCFSKKTNIYGHFIYRLKQGEVWKTGMGLAQYFLKKENIQSNKVSFFSDAAIIVGQITTTIVKVCVFYYRFHIHDWHNRQHFVWNDTCTLIHWKLYLIRPSVFVIVNNLTFSVELERERLWKRRGRGQSSRLTYGTAVRVHLCMRNPDSVRERSRRCMRNNL